MFIEVQITVGGGQSTVLINADQIIEVWPFKDNQTRIKTTNGDYWELKDSYSTIRNLLYKDSQTPK